jgi:hypothetical protein
MKCCSSDYAAQLIKWSVPFRALLKEDKRETRTEGYAHKVPHCSGCLLHSHPRKICLLDQGKEPFMYHSCSSPPASSVSSISFFFLDKFPYRVFISFLPFPCA